MKLTYMNLRPLNLFTIDQSAKYFDLRLIMRFTFAFSELTIIRTLRDQPLPRAEKVNFMQKVLKILKIR